jgi:hypothetical protein
VQEHYGSSYLIALLLSPPAVLCVAILAVVSETFGVDGELCGLKDPNRLGRGDPPKRPDIATRSLKQRAVEESVGGGWRRGRRER